VGGLISSLAYASPLSRGFKRRTDEGDGQQRQRQKVLCEQSEQVRAGRLARQPGRVPDTEHQPENITDAP